MNSQLFKNILILFFSGTISLYAQTGAHLSSPIHPIQMLISSVLPERYVQISYLSPYGLISLSDFWIRYNHPVPGGFVYGEVNAYGVPGFYRYHTAIGYGIPVKGMVSTGVSLNADFHPGNESLKHRIVPASSFFLSIHGQPTFAATIFLDNWTSLWVSPDFKRTETRLSVMTRFKPGADLALMAGMSYSKSRMPLYCAGISVKGGTAHEVMAGIQSSPTGFWLAYRLTMTRIDFMVSIRTSPIFGYEPGSSFLFHLN